jgi:hypothetical protein
MKYNEKRHNLKFLSLFEDVCEFISSVFSKSTTLTTERYLKNDINGIFLSNSIVFHSLKQDKTLKKSLEFLNKELNTATVYINRSNHNLVYAASAGRLHPGPTLYRHHADWRTTRAGN